MTNLFVARLEEQWTKALAALALNKWLVKAPGGAIPVTLDDLYELLFIDPQLTAKPETTQVASAIACVQQYINSVYNRMEPGFLKARFEPADVAYWQDIQGNLAVWKANEMVKDHPENVIEPSFRIKRTSQFRALEDNLNQARLTEDSVLVGVREYLRSFQETCDLEVISGYIDGEHFADAPYYFIGQERTPPYRYFWRQAQIKIEDDTQYVNPTAWGEWQLVDIPLTDNLLEIRPVFWRGRLFLVWASLTSALLNEAGSTIKLPSLELSAAFVTLNGQWSAPISLSQTNLDPGIDVSRGRLVAVVLRGVRPVDDCLAVYFCDTYDENVIPKLQIFEVRDTLLRKIERKANEDALRYLVKYHFRDAATLQHRSKVVSLPAITVERVVGGEGEVIGNLNSSLKLEEYLYFGETGDVLEIRGLCNFQVTEKTNATFTLKFNERTVNDPPDLSEVLELNGAAVTKLLSISRPEIDSANISFLFGVAAPTLARANRFRACRALRFAQRYRGAVDATYSGINHYKVTITARPVLIRIPKLEKTDGNAAQFLNFNKAIANQKFQYVRLNTLIGPQLVARADISVAAVLDWTTQHLQEPSMPGGGLEVNGPFDGANGLYFWELFFHLVHLITFRLRGEGRHLEAQRWSHYVFDPQLEGESYEDIEPDVPDAPAYWRCRPLSLPGDIAHELARPHDPDAIAYASPRHYQIAFFMGYVRTLIEWGDWLYRQQTRDSLSAAQLHYVRAQSLMGEAPEFGTINKWEPKTVAELLPLISERAALREFEKNFTLNLARGSLGFTCKPYLEMLGVEVFRAPLNQTLLDTYTDIKRRLFNLRHNLTLEGLPLSLELYAPAAEPRQLLSAQAAGNTGLARRMGGQLVVPPYRFSEVLSLASRALETYSRFSDQLMRCMELRDQGLQEELQQRHLIELGSFVGSIQQENINQLTVTQSALEKNRDLVQARAIYYETLANSNISAVEYQVMEQLQEGKTVASLGTAMQMGGAMVDLSPTVFGMAVGSLTPGGPLRAIAYAFQIGADSLFMDAERKATTEQYRRRQQEWIYSARQARLELIAIEEQIAAQRHAINGAQTGLLQAERANAQAQELYTFFKQGRATTVELNAWMVGQMKSLHFPAHDAVVALCQSVETCMRYETGDYETRPFIRSDVYVEKFHGMTATESLKLDLLLLEAEYTKRNERRLELIKTVSLRRLFDESTRPDEQTHPDWKSALAELQANGSVSFSLSQKLFDQDYPGHYCRQIKSVSVSLPVLTGPYQDVRAILVQSGSHTLTRPSLSAIEYMHQIEGSAAGPDIKINMRNSQQIGISRGLNDIGMFEINFDGTRYLPFEGTGAVSIWSLSFPRHAESEQKALLESLTDIIVTVNYMARDGGKSLADEVEKLLKPEPVANGR